MGENVKMRKLTSLLLSASALTLGLSGFSAVAQAQGSDDEIEEIVVSGLRGKPRSAVDSAVPVDTFDASQIQAVAATDTQDILQTLVPSYNVGRQPISDGASFIRPAELRGLPSHHTLVLINGKRRHRASLVSIGGSGTQGPDVATIPATAIQSVEVLRDGASSQYGSDAIAGVINFNLKQNSEGFDISLQSGQFFESDGTDYTIQGNIGLPLTQNGFLSISGEYTEADFTERAEAYCESWFCVDRSNERFNGSNVVSRAYAAGDPTLLTPGAEADSGYILSADDIAYMTPFITAFPDGTNNPHSASVAGTNTMPWGQPNNEAARVFYNAGIELGNGSEIYSFGNYSQSKGDGSFFYRYPFNGTIEMLRNADGSRYMPIEKFPGGFTPRFEGEVEDMSIAGGWRGTTDGNFSYDASIRYGSNEIDYRLFNTINPSYGIDSPTDFKPGRLQNEELQVQLDLSNEFDLGWESPLVFAYGLSYMDESYNVHESSDVASYAPGPHALADPYGFCERDANGNFTGAPTTVAGGGDFTQSIGGQAAVAGNAIADLNCGDPNDPVFNVVGVGSNGFPGYSPEFSDEYTRDSYAVYLDASADLTENFFLQAAIRYEDYSDFGDETVGKIAARWRLTDSFALRGSVGTGFRAPTPGQQGTTNVSTRLPNGFPVATGLFPAESAVSVALGANPLRPETSTSYTLGATWEGERLSVTVDFYNIDIEDRFNAISTLDVSPDPNGDPDAYARYLALVAAGVVGAESIGGVNYFQNAYDSKTQGVDIVASMPFDIGSGATLQFAMNYNENSLESDADDFLNIEDQLDFENADPNLRFNVSWFQELGNFSILARGRYFGESTNYDQSGGVIVGQQTFGETFFLDLEGTYRLGDNWTFAVGAMNILDEYPDKLDRVASDNDQCCGRTYSSGSIVPWQGGYYYGRIQVGF
jgi:iron complex outermembrane receptor protein